MNKEERKKMALAAMLIRFPGDEPIVQTPTGKGWWPSFSIKQARRIVRDAQAAPSCLSFLVDIDCYQDMLQIWAGDYGRITRELLWEWGISVAPETYEDVWAQDGRVVSADAWVVKTFSRAGAETVRVNLLRRGKSCYYAPSLRIPDNVYRLLSRCDLSLEIRKATRDFYSFNLTDLRKETHEE